MSSRYPNKKVLIITPFFRPNIGGVETYLNDVINILHEHGVWVDVITYQPLTSKTQALIHEHGPLLRIWRLPWVRGRWFYLLEKKHPLLQFIYLSTGILFCTAIYCLFNPRNRKEIIVFSQGLAAGVVGVMTSKLFKFSTYLNLHTNYRLETGKLLSRLISTICVNHKRTLILSESAKNNLTAIGVPPERVVVYHNWIKEDFYVPGDKNSSRKGLGISPEKLVMLFVGRLSPEKGVLEVINVAKKVKRNNIEFIIVGSGPLESEVAEASKTHKNIKFMGSQDEEKLKKYFWAADFLFYAPVDEDYLGRSAISALCCGLPIIIPRISTYMDKKTEVNVKLPKTIGFTLDNRDITKTSAIFEKYINKRTKYSPDLCRKYALKYYGKRKNSEIITNTLFQDELTHY